MSSPTNTIFARCCCLCIPLLPLVTSSTFAHHWFPCLPPPALPCQPQLWLINTVPPCSIFYVNPTIGKIYNFLLFFLFFSLYLRVIVWYSYLICWLGWFCWFYLKHNSPLPSKYLCFILMFYSKRDILSNYWSHTCSFHVLNWFINI